MALIHITETPRAILDRFGEIEELQSTGEGCTADLACIKTSRGRFVIKRSQGSQYAQWLERESRVLQSLASTLLPAPRLFYFYRPPESSLPEAWLVMSPLKGFTVSELLQKAPANERRLILTELGAALKMVHAQRNIPGLIRRDAGQWLEHMLEILRFC